MEEKKKKKKEKPSNEEQKSQRTGKCKKNQSFHGKTLEYALEEEEEEKRKKMVGFGKEYGPSSAIGGLVSQRDFGNGPRPLIPSPPPQTTPFPGASPLRSPRFLLSSELR